MSEDTIIRLFFSLSTGGLAALGAFAPLTIEGAGVGTILLAVFFLVLGGLSQLIIWRAD